MSRRVGLHIGDKLEANIANRDAAFFQCLALRALFKRFQILKMPAREGILACTMGTFSFAEQHRAILDNHDPDADLWLVLLHMPSYTIPAWNVSTFAFRGGDPLLGGREAVKSAERAAAAGCLPASRRLAARLSQEPFRVAPRRVLRRQWHLQIAPQQHLCLLEVALPLDVHFRAREQKPR